jgi:hypothetical protein
MFSNIDEHVRRMPRRPAGAELHPDPRESGPCWSHAMEGTSIPERSAALTCAGYNGIMRLEIGRSAFPSRRP